MSSKHKVVISCHSGGDKEMRSGDGGRTSRSIATQVEVA